MDIKHAMRHPHAKKIRAYRNVVNYVFLLIKEEQKIDSEIFQIIFMILVHVFACVATTDISNFIHVIYFMYSKHSAFY